MLRFLYQEITRGSVPRLFHTLGIDRLMLSGLNALYRRKYIRVVVYHDVPDDMKARFADHVAFWSSEFAPVSKETMREFLQSGRWSADRPGIILTFDDGLHNWIGNVLPVLERHGFVGWFLIPSDFPKVPVEQQRNYAKDHRIALDSSSAGTRCALSLEEIRELARNHVLVCHSKTHRRLGPNLSKSDAFDEIVRSRADLEAASGVSVEGFGWVGGENDAYSATAYSTIVEAGYSYALMTKSAPLTAKTNPFEIHRTAIGVEMPTRLLRYQVCGIVDVAYIWHRRAIRRRVSRAA